MVGVWEGPVCSFSRITGCGGDPNQNGSFSLSPFQLPPRVAPHPSLPREGEVSRSWLAPQCPYVACTGSAFWI